MKKERWPGELYDAEGRPWALRNARWIVWSRRKLRYPGRGGKTIWTASSLTALLIALTLFLGLSIAGTAVSLLRHEPLWPVLMNVGLWGGFSAVFLWRTYLPTRRYVVVRERVLSRCCPCCGYPLLHDERSGGDSQRRCAECGHVWKWPPWTGDEPYIGY